MHSPCAVSSNGPQPLAQLLFRLPVSPPPPAACPLGSLVCNNVQGESGLSLEGGGVAVTPWFVVLFCSWRRLLADRHSLPFICTLSLHRRWCRSASHHLVSFLFLVASSFPLHFPFLFLGCSLHRPWCPSASHHSFPFLSLGRLCQQSPQTCFTSLCRVHTEEGNCLA